ncbi:MAG: His/Gly/Thr/Pro-type tRNA ligase C-terminal domain-containing protein [Mycoplasmoidaceae bacterium]|nr:His/Gly/Thr/Pro-type tRNA ligase C-terminal domain-containing protein [Mycoplasmoidaceae bacterium]
MFYAIICDAYRIENIKDNETREVLGLPYALCPYKVAVLPLSNKLNDNAKKVFDKLIAAQVPSVYDVTGSIGKRYRRQDAIGTYFCITYDFDSEKDNCVTIRNRDTMKQERIKISEILNFLGKYMSRVD